MDLLARLEKRKEVWIVLGISILFIFLRLPSLFEPQWYDDEGIYQTIGNLLQNGRQLYTDVWDNKPPLLYLIYRLFNSDQDTIRFISLVFGLVSVGVFSLIAHRLFRKNIHALVTATGVFAVFFGLPYIEGNIANAENFLLLPVLLAMYLLLKLVYTNESFIFSDSIARKLFLPGLLLGTAFLLKSVVVFDILATVVILFCFSPPRQITLRTLLQTSKTFFYQLRTFLFGLLLPLVLTSTYFLLQGSLTEFLGSTVVGNVQYVSIYNQFIIPHGLLLIKIITVLLWTGGIYVYRNQLPKPLTIILLWSGFAVFNVFFSQRPYPHYLLVFLPTFSLLMGSIVMFREQRKFLLPLIVSLIFLIYYVFQVTLYKNPLWYYTNFISFASGQKSQQEYYTYFDKSVNKNYTIAQYLASHTKPQETVFLWTNAAQIYHMSRTVPPGRYLVEYHIARGNTTRAETAKDLIDNPPRFIVIDPAMSPFPFSLERYAYKVTIMDTDIYEKIR